MEQLTTVRELFRNREEYLDKEVSIGGWVRSIRDSKTFGFIVLNDGTFFEPIQVVYSDALPNFAEISKTNVGALRELWWQHLPLNSPLKYRQRIFASRVHRRPIIRFRKSVIQWSICVQ